MKAMPPAAKWLSGLLGLLLVAMPFHALLIGLVQNQLVEAWKEIVVLIAAGLAGYLLVQNKPLRQQLWKWIPNRLVLGFIALNIAYAFFAHNVLRAEIVGLRTNLLFLTVFLTAQIAGYYWEYRELSRRLLWWLLLPAAAVVVFGLIQALVPEQIVRIFHNNAFIVERPYQFLQNAPILRLNSSLWGPSQLGSYLVLPICLSLWLRQQKPDWRLSALLGGLIIMLYASQSRGAWLATAVGLLMVLLIKGSGRLRKKTIALTLAGGTLLLVAVLLVSLKIETPLSHILFHSKSNLALTQSSNVSHVQAMQRGIESWWQQWQGTGPGTAGPASAYNSRILYTESFYLQLLVEISIWGLLLFLIICGLVAKKLWRLSPQKPMAVPLLASFAGLVVLNLIHHAWTDGATSLLWWGSAGLILASKK